MLSVALVIFAAYTALDLAGRVTAARDWTRTLWLSGGALSMGLGIWAMHYNGMLAFSLPVPILYHYPTVIVSLLAAMAASAVALFTMSRVRMGWAQQVSGIHQGQSLGMITVSVGVATLPRHGTSPKDLLEAADAALYRAKCEGRDRVVDAAPRPEPAPDPTTSEIALSAAK